MTLDLARRQRSSVNGPMAYAKNLGPAFASCTQQVGLTVASVRTLVTDDAYPELPSSIDRDRPLQRVADRIE